MRALPSARSNGRRSLTLSIGLYLLLLGGLGHRPIGQGQEMVLLLSLLWVSPAMELECSSSSSESGQPPTRRSRSPSRSGAFQPLKPRVIEVGLVHHPTSPRWRPAEHTVNLGSFPWIQTLCPIMGAAAPLRPHPHMPQQDIYHLVRATMQDWSEPLVPVWPALSMGALHLVPCPPPPPIVRRGASAFTAAGSAMPTSTRRPRGRCGLHGSPHSRVFLSFFFQHPSPTW